MENVYYLTHPRMDKTAVVYAPTTEKARTTFLDWLERNNLIRRSHRNFFRKDMIAERIEDPNVPTDVVLNYGYQEAPTRRLSDMTEEKRNLEFGESPEVREVPVRFEEPEGEDLPVEGVEEPREVQGDLRQEKQLEDLKAMREASGRMPIQEVMLRGYGK